MLSGLVALLGLIASAAGVFGQGEGNPVLFTTLRGQQVQLQGHGLYQYDSVSGAAQQIGGDVVTLFIGVPVLLFSIFLAARGSLRGRLLLSGTLGYFLYTYASVAFLLAYNQLFLLYVALFSLSLFALIISLTTLDLKELPAHFSSTRSRWPVAGFLFLIGTFLIISWVGRLIIPPLLKGEAPTALESYTTLVIQVLDLGVIVPIMYLSGVLWLKRSALGYLLVSVVLIKVVMLSAAISAMIIVQAIAGVAMVVADFVMFPIIGLVGVGMLAFVLTNVKEKIVAPPISTLPNLERNSL